MTVETHQFANTRAARMLDAAIKHYTAQHPGGLRALAKSLGLSQATVLSAMATGRMGIPMERAADLAIELGLDVGQFCLAVVEQRAPGFHQALDQAFGWSKFGNLTNEQWEIIKAAVDAKSLTREHADIVGEVIYASRPRDRWLAPLETGIMRPIRDRFPDGVPYNEIEPLAAAIEAHLADPT